MPLPVSNIQEKHRGYSKLLIGNKHISNLMLLTYLLSTGKCSSRITTESTDSFAGLILLLLCVLLKE
jgi:hypothetical protein